MDYLLSSAYLPPVQYFSKLYVADKVFVEQHDHYLKQTYRNRCVIAAADGPLTLSIPTEKYAEVKCPMKDIRISDHGNWRHLHWNALVSAYHTSPFFEYYQDDIRPFYEKKYPFLCDFNEAICAKMCELIDMQPSIQRTETYLQPDENLLDFRASIHPKCDYRKDVNFRAQPYYQVFQAKYGFLPNLSVIDLLFNMGPESLLVLRDSYCASSNLL